MSRLSSFLKNPARVPAKLPNPSAKRIAVSPTEIEIWHAHHARQSGAPQLIGTKGMRPIGALIAGIADEPTTALDVTIQAKILALMVRLKRETGTAVMFIAHDMAVVA